MKVGRYFATEPTDELELDARARKRLSGRALTGAEVRDIARESGVDCATRALYISLAELQHRQFIETIDKMPAQKKAPLPNPLKLLIVPGLLYREYPEFGASGELTCSIAKKCGLDVRIIPVLSKGAISDNAAIVRQEMASENGPFWVLSISKGSAEVRVALEKQGDADTRSYNLQGWIDVCGIMEGTPLADYKLRSRTARGWSRLWCSAFGLSYLGLTELSTHHALWQESLKPLAGTEVIHIAGFPILAHVQAPILNRWEYLSQYGPNDGMRCLASLAELPGSVYPFWGADHFMRTPRLSLLYYKIFNYIVETQKDRGSTS